MKKLLTIILLLISQYAFSQGIDNGRQINSELKVGIKIPVNSYSYLNQVSNNQTVLVAPYLSLVTTAGNLGANGQASREFLIKGQRARIRQDGIVTRIRLSIDNASVITGDTIYIRFWRKNGTNYDYIGSTENIAPLVQQRPTVTDITLTNTVTVKEGDYISIRLAKTSGNFSSQSFLTGVSNADYAAYLVNNFVFPANYNWEGSTSIAYYIPVEIYMNSPVFVGIGNSIMAGHAPHYSFLETTQTTNIDSTIGKELARLTGYTYQNMGIGSQTTKDIRTRITADVVNLKPRFILLEGGVNDVAGGLSSDSIIKNYTAIYDTLQANNIKCVQLAIMPWGNGTEAQMRQIDSINIRLQTLTSSYSNFLFLNINSSIGKFRTGGDAGNLWDIKTEYDDGGHIHYKTVGYLAIARAIYSLLR